MKQKKIFNKKIVLMDLVFLSVYIAWFFLSAVIPYVGYINLGHTQITFLSLLVPIATFHLGIKGNLISGLGFGLSSFTLAFILGATKYTYFDISVLPRIEMALVIYGFSWAFGIFKKPKMWKIGILAFLASFFNIFFVLSAQYIREAINPESLGKNGVPPIHLWIITHPINLTVEPIVCIIIACSIFPLIKYLKNKYQGNKQVYYQYATSV
ncbi:hypothetical protein [Mycoplasmopsis maculosa]|nr:hypothetical protein [Mycoplasmopsis maculosa]